MPQHLPGLGQKGQIQRNEICLFPFGSLQRSTKTKLPDIASLDRGQTARRRGSDYPLNSVLCPTLPPLSVRSKELGFSHHSAPSSPFSHSPMGSLQFLYVTSLSLKRHSFLKSLPLLPLPSEWVHPLGKLCNP